MQIVTDSGTDINLSPREAAELNVHTVPLNVTLDGITYQEGVNIKPEEFYQLLEKSENLPITSQPSAGQFAELYRKLATEDPEILSVHMTSGLSGTYNSALAGAEMVPEARVTHFDTKTLSAVAGWQVEAAARAGKAGWAVDRILQLLKRIGDACESIYTLDELKYLIHGGRISHMKGLIASLINIKPMIGVEKENGTYIQLGQVRTFKGALQGLVKQMKKKHQPGSEIHVQVLHSFNPEGASMLIEQIEKIYKCNWLPLGPMSLVLGAHTGPSMVGVAFGPRDIFEDIPRI
jgi:DegV family protein with EDD domain